jgi:cation/acetate symporter
MASLCGDYLSASFLGICGLIATLGYDGSYSIIWLAGSLHFRSGRTLKRQKYTLQMQWIQYNRVASNPCCHQYLVVSMYLIPQMVGWCFVEPLGIPIMGLLEQWLSLLLPQQVWLYNICAPLRLLIIFSTILVMQYWFAVFQPGLIRRKAL